MSKSNSKALSTTDNSVTILEDIPKKPLTDRENLKSQAGALVSIGCDDEYICQTLGIGQKQLTRWRNAGELTIDSDLLKSVRDGIVTEYMIKAGEYITTAVDILQDRLKSGEMQTRDIYTSVGVIADKLSVLQGITKPIYGGNATQININFEQLSKG